MRKWFLCLALFSIYHNEAIADDDPLSPNGFDVQWVCLNNAWLVITCDFSYEVKVGEHTAMRELTSGALAIGQESVWVIPADAINAKFKVTYATASLWTPTGIIVDKDVDKNDVQFFFPALLIDAVQFTVTGTLIAPKGQFVQPDGSVPIPRP